MTFKVIHNGGSLRSPLTPTFPQHNLLVTVPQSALQLLPIEAQAEGKYQSDPTMKNHYIAKMPQLETFFPDGRQGCPFGPDVAGSMQHEPLIPGHLTDGSMGLGGGNSTMDI